MEPQMLVFKKARARYESLARKTRLADWIALGRNQQHRQTFRQASRLRIKRQGSGGKGG